MTFDIEYIVVRVHSDIDLGQSEIGHWHIYDAKLFQLEILFY
jgi:hypothetical protein